MIIFGQPSTTISMNNTIEVGLKKINPELIERIIKARGIEDRHKAVKMMRHSCWTVKQFADLTGKTVHQINKALNYGSMKGGELRPTLNVCFPFVDLDGDGPKFVLRDSKSEKFIENSL